MTPTTIVWLKALHLIGIVIWMGSLLTLSRILGFHVQEDPATVQPRFSNFEKRMYRFVATPGLVLALGAGLYRFASFVEVYRKQPWMHAKLTLVALVVILHVVLGMQIGDLAANPAKRGKGKYMAVHGTIGLCIVFVIILATVQPWQRAVTGG
jgi:putative membrane protein